MILPESFPAIKTFTRHLAAIPSLLLLVRCLGGFLDHRGRMSATQAAGAIRTAPCHRANVGRYLGRLGRRRDWQLLEQRADQLLGLESRCGTWVLLLDSTYVGGREDCVEDLLAHPGIESMPAELGDDITAASDRVNPAPPVKR